MANSRSGILRLNTFLHRTFQSRSESATQARPVADMELNDRDPVQRGRSNTSDGTASRSSVQLQTVFKDLEHNELECVICFESLGWTGPLWSCPTCYHAFHFNCIETWAQNSRPDSWLCPLCKASQLDEPEARCWCRKRLHTDLPNLGGNTCNTVCSRTRPCPNQERNCVRLCDRICHPGPCESACPPCIAPQVPERIVPHGALVPAEHANNSLNRIVRPRQRSNRSTRFSQRWSQFPVRTLGTTLLIQAVLHAAFLLYVVLGHIPWQIQPLRYQRYTEYVRDSTEASYIAVAAVATLFNTLFCVLVYIELRKRLLLLFNLERPANPAPWRRWILTVATCSLGLYFIISPWIFFFVAPKYAWRAQMKHSCDGFDTRVQLDTKHTFLAYVDYNPASEFTLYIPNDIGNISAQRKEDLASAGVGTFEITEVNDYRVSYNETFRTFIRVHGNLEAHVPFAVEYDLASQRYRIPANAAGPWNKFGGPLNDAYFRTHGIWSTFASDSPHTFFPEINLKAPNFDRFMRNRLYQPFMQFFKTTGMTTEQIERQAAEKWTATSKSNVVMRTASFGLGNSGLEVCAKRYAYPAKASGGTGVKFMEGMGDDLMIPLGLMAALRIDQETWSEED